MSKIRTNLSASSTLILLVFPGFFLLPPPAFAELDPDREFEFAAGLVDLGLSDYAKTVVERILHAHPGEADRAKLVEARILIARRKLAEAEKIVSKMDANDEMWQAIRLELAQAYYRHHEPAKARVFYEDFFKAYEHGRPTNPDLRRSFIEATFTFGQMLESAGDYGGAVSAYDRALAAKPDKNTALRMMAEQCMLYVRLAEEATSGSLRGQHAARVRELADKIQWQGITIWFGHSVVAMARAELVLKKPDKAEELLRSHLDILKEIERVLKEQHLPLSVSPMAPARFLIGEINEAKGDRMARLERKEEAKTCMGKALTEYYNVFAKYPDSDWGPEAGARGHRIKKTLEGMGYQVKVDFGEHASKAVYARFKLADRLYADEEYEEAIRAYLDQLNRFPETDAAPRALVNLARCYVEIGNDLYVKMICRYVTERFRGADTVPAGLLSIGKMYFDRKNEKGYTYVYDLYLDTFPDDGQAPAILYTLAGLKAKSGDVDGARALYDRIIRRYTEDQHYLKAINQTAWQLYAAGDYETAIERWNEYIEAERPGHDKAHAVFTIADCHLRLERVSDALAAYERVIRWLAPKESDYNTSEDDAKRNEELLRKSLFQRGFCYARLDEPADKVRRYREKAIEAYGVYLERYPHSDIAPAAMSARGSLLLGLGAHVAAAKTFSELSSKYPESAEGKRALFDLIRSALRSGLHDAARSAFGQMLQNPPMYGADQFVRVGQMLLEGGLREEAVAAFDEALIWGGEVDRKVLERALFGRGKAYFELNRYSDAIAALNELMTRYEKSGLFYDAKFMLAIAGRETGDLQGAREALSDIFKYAEDTALRQKASLHLGRIQKEEGLGEPALASFMRVALLADPSDEAQRPTVEACTLEAIDLCVKLARYEDGVDLIDQYLRDFGRSDSITSLRKLRQDLLIRAAGAAIPLSDAADTQP